MTAASSADETSKDFVDDILRFSLLKEEAKEELQVCGIFSSDLNFVELCRLSYFCYLVHHIFQ